jgi:ABC-type multidrug transport system fused ATPase/permease subunit
MMNSDGLDRSARLSKDLYLYVWQTSRSRQIMICLLTMLLAPLMTVPLELQRRIVDYALVEKNVSLLMALGGAYFGIICLQGGIKYLLNMLKGTAVEMIARDIRAKIVGNARKLNELGSQSGGGLNSGEIVSMLAAEAEDVSGFGGEALGLPLLAGGTILYVAAYLIWVQPAIAILAVIIYLPQAVIVPVTQHTINRLARLRIRTVRSLGHLAVRVSRGDILGGTPGHILINRIYRLRILIYLRKYSLAALGNFLDSLGSIIVLTVGGYLVIQDKTEVGTLVVFISGLAKIADPWDQLINFYRSVSNTAVAYEMIRSKLEASRPVSVYEIRQAAEEFH